MHANLAPFAQALGYKSDELQVVSQQDNIIEIKTPGGTRYDAKLTKAGNVRKSTIRRAK
jgi:hypothetical protein